ncbi:HCLS1-associated protein X-1 isoform 2-T2 [Discoglossus pictus]
MTEDDDDEEDEDDVGYPFGQPPRHDFGFSFGPGRSPFQDAFGFEEFFRDFNELVADFGAITRGVPELPGIEAIPQKPEGSRSRSLRDSMLKCPDSHLPSDQTPDSQAPSVRDRPKLPGGSSWRRFHWDDGLEKIPEKEARQDKDLDSEVSSQGLDTILSPAAPRSSSFFQSVSVSRVTRPDGTVEERRTVRDGQGNTSTTVTIQRGDQIISTTKQDGEDHKDPTQEIIRRPPDLSDSETILGRIFQRWFTPR